MTGRSLQVARGLNTIAANLVSNEEYLADYGVAIKDNNGELLSTFDILAQLAAKWEGLTSAEKVEIGQTIAGKNQYKVFAAVMSNFDSAIAANAKSIEAHGSALKGNARYMESYEA